MLFQVFIDRSSSLRIDASDRGGGPDLMMFLVPGDVLYDVPGDVPCDLGGGPDLMMFLVPIAKDANGTMTVEYSPSTIDLEKKSKINLSTWPPLR